MIIREIKFRIWIRKQQRFFIFSIENLLQSKVSLKFEDGDKIEQFTGLKDKNGKEIYEGDIIKSESSYLINGKRGKIKIIKNTVAWCEIQSGFKPFCEAWDEDGTPFIQVESNIEIIGNIHEK